MTTGGTRRDERLDGLFELFQAGTVVTLPDVRFSPICGAYPLYEDDGYARMADDESRTRIYRAAIDEIVTNRSVVEIGTGARMVLARYCAEAGARIVYAIEISEGAYRTAKALLRDLGLENRIVLIHGDATRVELPEQVDVCVSEILGSIGSAEGVVAILNSARRFLKPGGAMIPARSVTRIAAVRLPPALSRHPGFTRKGWSDVARVFAHFGYPFDVRVGIRGVGPSDLISNADVFEDLVFAGPGPTDYARRVSLTIDRAAPLDGFLLWLQPYTTDSHTIDVLHEATSSWSPVFLPVFYPGVPVAPGDRIEATCTTTLSDDGIFPDYRIRGRLVRRSGRIVDFEYTSAHHEPVFRRNRFYEDLFSPDRVTIIENRRPSSGIQRAKRLMRGALRRLRS